MSKFDNAFDNLGGNREVDPDFVKIDWDVVNKQRAETFGTQDKAKSRVGIISGIIDLGIQPVEAGHKKSEVALEDEAAYIEKNPTNWFEDFTQPKTKTVERHVFWPNKPQRAVAVTVDFPKFTHDWGGEIGEKPFRFLLNGEFIHKGMKRSDIVVARTYDLKETTKDFNPRWSLAKNSFLYKAAIATDVIKDGEPFTKKQIGSLIGKAALFEVRFWLEDGYANERISFKGAIPEGMNVPTIDESLLYYINLDGENDEDAVKQLRKSIKNTIKNSVSFETSKLKEQYGKYFETYKKEDKADSAVNSAPADEEDDTPDINFDDGAPF